MELIDLSGKVALVTGGARGQGRSHALRLARAGAHVVVTDIAHQIETIEVPMAVPDDLEMTAQLLTEAGAKFKTHVADVRDFEAMEQVVTDTMETFGRLDIVCANAGVVLIAEPWQTSKGQWDDVIGVNLTGVQNTLAAASRAMIKQGDGGVMILTGSVCSQRSQLGLAAYTASKHGVLGLTRAYALELAPHGIRVNVVEPGNVITPMIDNQPMFDRLRPDLEDPTRDDAAEAFARMNPMPVPWVEADDISSAVVWLASDNARFVTGAEIPVDAGLLVG